MKNRIEYALNRYAFGDSAYRIFYIILWILWLGVRLLVPAAVIALIVFAISGCASTDGLRSQVGAGSAKYTFSRRLADGSVCSVDILSARDVIDGQLVIDKDCALTSKAGQTQGVAEAMQAVQKALDLVKAAAVP